MSSFLVTFLSTHHALKGEKEARKISTDVTLIPTPREISSECGFSLYLDFNIDDVKIITENIVIECLYSIKKNSQGKKTYEKIS